MIKAVDDKIVVEVMKPGTTKGGLVIPTTTVEPQSYGKVMSVGENVGHGIKMGYILVFHAKAGMDMVMSNKIMKVLKYGEVWGVLQEEDLIGRLEGVTIG
jgi:co-chaperonin GroES (HSP10)